MVLLHAAGLLNPVKNISVISVIKLTAEIGRTVCATLNKSDSIVNLNRLD